MRIQIRNSYDVSIPLNLQTHTYEKAIVLEPVASVDTLPNTGDGLAESFTFSTTVQLLSGLLLLSAGIRRLSR